ncbi:hypothetical protein THAOC_00598, partial [Thalassiosira oceanica]
MLIPTRILTPVAVLAAILGSYADNGGAQTAQTEYHRTHRHADAEEQLQGSESTVGVVVQSLFRFPASQLGKEFDELLNIWYRDWLHLPAGKDGAPTSISPEEKGLEHAFHS